MNLTHDAKYTLSAGYLMQVSIDICTVRADGNSNKTPMAPIHGFYNIVLRELKVTKPFIFCI